MNGSSTPVQQASKGQYIVGKSTAFLPQGVEPLNLAVVEQAFNDAPDIEIVKKIAPRGFSALSTTEAQSQAIIVARMTEERVQALKQSAGDQLLVEPDHYLSYTQPPVALPENVFQELGVVVANGLQFNVAIAVKDEHGQQVANAHVYLYGRQSSKDAVTDGQGRVHLTLFGETGEGLRALYVEPETDYWNLVITSPQLDPAKDNVVTLKSFDQTFPNFPNQQEVGWGEQAMKLDRLPSSYTGTGARVAVIDSGAATTHRDIQTVKEGYDITQENDHTWNQDTVFHGTHCTGIIAGVNDDQGIRGFAPEAEVFALKILPGGQFSSLIEALERCIELQIDVTNLSIGSDQPSQLVEQSIQKAKAQGVACIVAAGNSSGPVQYPGSSPNVLTVAAIGKQGTFPPDSKHATQVFTSQGNPFTAEGYFSAMFSCFGPRVDVCAPGVAILSSVPPNNYAMWDGTSMATPHVTGLAALILAHHPDFQGQGPYAKRDERRVDRLFQILKQSAQPLALGDPSRVGAGLPDAMAALGLSPSAVTPGPTPSTAWQQILEILQRLASQAGTQPGGSTQNVAPQSVGGGSVSPLSVGGGNRSGEDIDTQLRTLKSLMQQAGL